MKNTRECLAELDWKTSTRNARLEAHWRFLLCMLLGTIPCTLIWHRAYPDVFGFGIFWAGFATGFAVGAIPGLIWQLRSRARRQLTSGNLVIGGTMAWMFFATCAIVVMAHFFKAQEDHLSEFRALANGSVTAVTISGYRSGIVSDQAAIHELMRLVAVSELLYRSHESSSEVLKIHFHYGSESIDFAASVPNLHQEDVAVRVESAEILIGGGRKWLDKYVN
jgi:hypothetical protein